MPVPSLPAAPVGSPDANGNLVGTPTAPIDPKLGPLANNGGPTQTCPAGRQPGHRHGLQPG